LDDFLRKKQRKPTLVVRLSAERAFLCYRRSSAFIGGPTFFLGYRGDPREPGADGHWVVTSSFAAGLATPPTVTTTAWSPAGTLAGPVKLICVAPTSP